MIKNTNLRQNENISVEKARGIRLLILDVDGVLTDGRIVMDSDGREWKNFDVRDGHGLVLLRKAGIAVALISGRKSEAVNIRARELGITLVYQGIHEKKTVFKEILREGGYKPEEVAFVGDDLPDLPLFKGVGWAVAVADGQEELKKHAAYVTDNKGGRGAVRETCELILKAQGKWEGIVRNYL